MLDGIFVWLGVLYIILSVKNNLIEAATNQKNYKKKNVWDITSAGQQKPPQLEWDMSLQKRNSEMEKRKQISHFFHPTWSLRRKSYILNTTDMILFIKTLSILVISFTVAYNQNPKHFANMQVQ